MNLGVKAYQNKTSGVVVISKDQFENCNENDFTEVMLFMPDAFIRNKYEELEFLCEDYEDDEDEEDYEN